MRFPRTTAHQIQPLLNENEVRKQETKKTSWLSWEKNLLSKRCSTGRKRLLQLFGSVDITFTRKRFSRYSNSPTRSLTGKKNCGEKSFIYLSLRIWILSSKSSHPSLTYPRSIYQMFIWYMKEGKNLHSRLNWYFFFLRTFFLSFPAHFFLPLLLILWFPLRLNPSYKKLFSHIKWIR